MCIDPVAHYGAGSWLTFPTSPLISSLFSCASKDLRSSFAALILAALLSTVFSSALPYHCMPFRFPLARTPAQVTPRATPPTSPLISSLSSALPKGRLRSLLTALILAAFSTNIFSFSCALRYAAARRETEPLCACAETLRLQAGRAIMSKIENKNYTIRLLTRVYLSTSESDRCFTVFLAAALLVLCLTPPSAPPTMMTSPATPEFVSLPCEQGLLSLLDAAPVDDFLSSQ